jgi:hypothetical protein
MGLISITHLTIRRHSKKYLNGRWLKKGSELIYMTVPDLGPDLLQDGFGYHTAEIERMERAAEDTTR